MLLHWLWVDFERLCFRFVVTHCCALKACHRYACALTVCRFWASVCGRFVVSYCRACSTACHRYACALTVCRFWAFVCQVFSYALLHINSLSQVCLCTDCVSISSVCVCQVSSFVLPCVLNGFSLVYTCANKSECLCVTFIVANCHACKRSVASMPAIPECRQPNCSHANEQYSCLHSLQKCASHISLFLFLFLFIHFLKGLRVCLST